MADAKRLRRSTLAVPGSSEGKIAKAVASGADMVFIDLEDSVVAAEKANARTRAARAVSELDWGRSGRGVRINAVSTPWCHDDLIEVVTIAGEHIDVVILPKATGPREVWFVADLLSQLEVKLGLAQGRIGIEVIIEEAVALERVGDIAVCSPRLESLVLGVGDLAASLGMRLGHIGLTDGAAAAYPGDVWHHARMRLITAARAAGIEVVDGPHSDVRDLAGAEASAASFALLGGGGKWCIHPTQIEVVNRVFSPSQAEIDEAVTVIAAMEAASAAGEGAASLDGVMIDAATARVFEQRLDRARLCGLI